MEDKNQKKQELGWMTPDWLYNQIMGEINPDLLLENVDKLEMGEGSEMEDNFKSEKYDLDFAIFDHALEMFNSSFVEEARKRKQAAQKQISKEEAEEKEESMEEIESSLNDSLATNG